MLEVARTRLPDVPLHLFDMRKLDLGRQFDAVVCLFSSIGYITDPSELRSTIARLAAHVGPGGVLILDGWVRPSEWSDTFRGDPDVASDGEMMVVRLSLSRRVGNVTELDMHHLVRTESGIEYFVETHRLALTPTEEYVSAVENAGLKARVVPFMPARDRIVGTRN
jgi:SAM-dependent methyltransferase